jgi:hypothetical protein
MRLVFSALFLLGVFVAVLDSTGALAVATNAASGPIPGAGLLSYLALGAIGLGTAAWKRFRK